MGISSIGSIGCDCFDGRLHRNSLSGVNMADGDGQGVCGVGGFGDLFEVEEASDHELNLFLFCEAVADDAGLDFEGSVLGDGKFLACSGEKGDAANLSQLECGLGVHGVEDLLDSDGIWLPTLEFGGKLAEDLFEAFGGFERLLEADGSHSFADEHGLAMSVVRFDDTKASHLGSAVDSKHPHRVQVYRRYV